jgi:hypothetical protein
LPVAVFSLSWLSSPALCCHCLDFSARSNHITTSAKTACSNFILSAFTTTSRPWPMASKRFTFALMLDPRTMQLGHTYIPISRDAGDEKLPPPWALAVGLSKRTVLTGISSIK